MLGTFEPVKEKILTVHDGPIRQINETVLRYNNSAITMRSISYAHWNAIELRFRIQWNEELKRLKLAFPTAFRNSTLYCEIPGGAINRPADGQEHVHGRWCFLEGTLNGEHVGFGIVNNGQHGLDFLDGEIRLSVLRSAAYCHEQGFPLNHVPARKYMDQGVHDIRLLITGGQPDDVLSTLPAYADWLASTPAVFAHLPIGSDASASLISVKNPGIRLLALKRSNDGQALIIRLQESIGRRTKTDLQIGRKRQTLTFHPFQIITLRVGKNGTIKNVALLEER
jgi:alpha-mannosidase